MTVASPLTSWICGSVGNAKPTLMTSLFLWFHSERATDASVEIAGFPESASTNEALWLSTVIRASGHTCAMTPATKFACPARASRNVSSF